MQHAASLVVAPDFRSIVAAVAERLGGVRLVVEPAWQNVADQFDVTTSDEPGARPLFVGSPAMVLKHASAEHDEFGFVAPDAQITRAWQRAPQWRDDITLRLWDLGWSPMRLDRLLVPVEGARIEYVIGSVRRTPAPASPESPPE